MQAYAESFYKSQAWKNTRTAYAKSVGGLCEKCKEQGIIKAGDIVHHKIHITPMNIVDTNITLDWSNLQLVCRDCHAKIHGSESVRRYNVDEYGRVTPMEVPHI